ncbi:sigma factor-like helix-turn-helix DNA-binding protein [Nocardia puris]|uniref:sigma factor-like helix-turn-helix DNA-binding protein n=1 Tax=Nocardia puris TaxID=208602 RepID=UPI0011BF70DF|nr:sigma factor-like helix-turn-helix DNA-binding protein [Nocardia puris]
MGADEARPHIVEMLDALRRQEEALRVSKPRYMVLARKHGLSEAEIAELLGMSESGVRAAIRRADGTPGMEIGGAL